MGSWSLSQAGLESECGDCIDCILSLSLLICKVDTAAPVHGVQVQAEWTSKEEGWSQALLAQHLF